MRYDSPKAPWKRLSESQREWMTKKLGEYFRELSKAKKMLDQIAEVINRDPYELGNDLECYEDDLVLDVEAIYEEIRGNW